MNPKLTELVVILDKSGSMGVVRDDTIGGFNTLIADQRKGEGDIKVSLALFDGTYKLVHNGEFIKDVPELTSETYAPSGSTALLDAVGKTIDDVGHRLANTPEDERPSKVIVAIITDGQENASSEYTKDQICEKITHQREKYNWEFLFLGANQDSFAEAGSIGIQAIYTCNYSQGHEKAAHRAIGVFTRSVRTGEQFTSGGLVECYDNEAKKDNN